MERTLPLGEYRDPFDGKRKLFPDNETPSIDHILTQKEFKNLINRNSRLTKDQKKDLIKQFRTDPDNLQSLPKYLNSSKGSKVETGTDGWQKYVKENKDIAPEYREYLKGVQDTIRQKVDKAIREAIKQGA